MPIDLTQLDTSELAAVAASCVRTEMAVGCQLLEVAACWADHYPGDGLPLETKINEGADERQLLIAGDGTPDVAEGAAADLAMEIRMSPAQARTLVEDALNLRHRFPFIWERIHSWRVPAWQARLIAQKTSGLTKSQAQAIDLHLAGQLGNLSKTRLQNLLDAEMTRVDRQNRERQAKQAAEERALKFGRPDQNNLVDLWGKFPAADALHMDGALDRLADILMARRDDLPAGVPTRGAKTKDSWRTVAASLSITNPALALQLLIEDQQPGLFDGQATDEVEELTARIVKKIDTTKLMPTETLHIHIAAEAFVKPEGSIARVEKIGPALLSTVRSWLGEGCRVRLLPIIDVAGIVPVDRYETPDRMRDALLARTPASIFPWSSSLNRNNDLDHTIRYVPIPAGPPGQTGLHNLGPLARSEHRPRTFGRMQVRQPWPGTYVWRTRFGRVLIVNDSGTHDLGKGDFAQRVWALAKTMQPSALTRAA